MQNPITPTPLELTASEASRKSIAPRMSLAACSRLSAIISLPASSGSVVVAPRYRSGARAENPAAAKRSTTSRMWGTSPHHSWMTMTPGPVPPAAGAK